nr:capsid protein [Cressdnaviricota sp.]
MAYARNTQYRRRANTNRQRTARRATVRAFRGAATTRTALRRNRYMPMSAGHQEVKLIDGTAATPGANALNLNSTGQVTCVNLISSGSGFNNRIGRKIDLKSLHLTGLIAQTGTASTTNDYARICVIYDRQTNGVLPTYAEIFTNYSQSSTTASTSFSGLNPDNRERFVMLADQRLVLPATPVSGVNGSVDALSTTFSINRFLKLNQTTMYKGDTSPSIIGDIATGAVYIVTIGSIASGSEPYRAQLTWRLRYMDS